MDAYELPEEFAHLQAQDMSKIGFINDLIRGIKKVVKKEAEKPKEKPIEKETVVEDNNYVQPIYEEETYVPADSYIEELER